MELSGIVVDAKNPKMLNKEVCALVPGGAYAEYCVANENLCLPLPFDHTVSDRFVKSAGIVENLFTVWKNLFHHDHLRTKKRMLFHGGSGGIGMTATKLAKSFGVEQIIVTAGSDKKCKKCLEMGADLALNYKDEEFPWESQVLEDGKVDVILDVVSENTFVFVF